MAKARLDQCPTCKAMFYAPTKTHSSGIGEGKICPNGHYNSILRVMAMRKEWEAAASPADKQEGHS